VGREEGRWHAGHVSCSFAGQMSRRMSCAYPFHMKGEQASSGCVR
jgi:hypothetical protein